MGEFKPTLSQQQVIDARNKNVLVSAAAGSGKTAVLTERIAGRLLDKEHPVSIDRLLIVTFTEAAASEMRERIAKAIGKRLKADPGNEFLRKQFTLVNSALIMTIHGFCLYLIRNHFDRIGIDPSFRVQSSEEGKILLEDSMEEAILLMQQENPEAYDTLQDIRDCEINDEKIREIVRKINAVAESQPFPEEWYKKMRILVSENGDDPEGSILFKDSLTYETKVLTECLNDINALIADVTAVQDDENRNELQKFLTVFENDRTFVQNLLACNSVRERNAIHRANSFTRMPSGKMSHVDPDYRKALGNARTSWKDRILQIEGNMYVSPYETVLGDEKNSSEIILHFLTLSENLMKCYAANKKKKNVIDFSDMEHFALQILLEKEGDKFVPSETALAYRDFFEEVMVDEYQDSNAIQEALLNAVANIKEDTGNRFMVGDVKQSIYRFRLARPEIFRKKYDDYRSISPTEKVEDIKERDIRIDLSQNFRSRQEVLSSVNRVFEDAMIREVGEIDYDVSARLNLGAVYPENTEGADKSELIVLQNDEWSDTDLKSGIAKEAHACGKRILEFIENHFQVADKNDLGEDILRDVRFSDIIILLRKTAKRAVVIKNVLESMGIPTVVLSKEGYFSAAEVQLMLNVISVIDNPLQDIPLLGVLHSFIGSFRETELAEIKSGRKKHLLYDALKEYAKDGENEELKQKISAFLEKLGRYRTLSGRVGIYELLLHIIEEEGIFDHFRAMKAGEIRIANLKLLLARAKDYSATGYSGIFTFIQYIENIRKKEIDFGEANLLDENANVVRIFTMHKSKGLEFPVCFLLGMGEDLNKSADKNAIVIETGVGIGMDYTDLAKRVKRPTVSKNMILYRSKVEQRGEELRLLYVAMTRAKEKLIMIGSATNSLLEATDVGPNRQFRYHEIMGATSFLSFLYPEALRNPDLFDLRFFSPDEIETADAGTTECREELRAKLESIPASEKRSFFKYPYKILENVYKKTTVSELKRAAYQEEEDGSAELYPPKKEKAEERDEYIPQFMQEDAPKSGAAYGTAFHALMELLDFEELSSVMEKYKPDGSDKEAFKKELSETVNAQIERFTKSYELSGEESKLIRKENTVKFLMTDYAYRMMKADRAGKLYREQPFVFAISASRLDPSFPEEEKVLIQGVIDVYFEEDRELVLLDYKTDRIAPDELMKRYHAQLEYYTEALKKLEGKKVKEAVLYSVHNDCFVEYKKS